MESKKQGNKKSKKKKMKINIGIKTCAEVIKEYNEEGKIDKESKEYNTLLRCIEEKNREQIKEAEYDETLYPHLDDPNFNLKIYKKKEFNDTKYEIKSEDDFQRIVEITDKICESKEFELNPHQMFVRNYLSFETPYNSLLLYHGLGTGKTCSAISVSEEMRRYNNQLGISKKIIVVASDAVQKNFKVQLFDKRKLKQVNGLWNIKACTGNNFLKEINPMNMRGLPESKVIKQIRKIIRQSYTFFGYTQFSNYLKTVMDQFVTRDDDILTKKKKQIKALKREFSNRMLIIDEIHNLRVIESNPDSKKIMRESSKNIEYLVRYADNLKLMILSATPMFNSHEEIVWLLNVLNTNDNRYTVSLNEIFDSRGNFLEGNGSEVVGKELLKQKAAGYISYVRGENPFTFPNRVFPREARNPDSLLLKMQEGIWNYPEIELNGDVIIEPIKILDLALVNTGIIQEVVYNKRLEQMLEKLRKKKGKKNKKLGFTSLESLLQILIMSYPDDELGVDDDEEEIVKGMYGKDGLNRIMKYKPKTKNNFEYKNSTLEKYGRIFSPDEIGKYSGKIKSFCENIKKSKGLIFVYTQYIDSGVIPLALALEEMGFSRYDGKNFFKTRMAAPIDYRTMEPYEDGNGIQAKYGLITGNSVLTPNLNNVRNEATNNRNSDGKDIKVIIVTRAGSEGIDFGFIRQMHIFDPWYNLNRIEQIIGRAVRNKSHCLLPYKERNVEIFLYASVMNDLISKKDNGNLLKESADLYIYRLAESKAKKIGMVTRVLKECAVDCLLNNEGLNFTQEIMNKEVEQKLSSGSEIMFRLGDKNDSPVCDYMECEYACNVKLEMGEKKLNSDTYSDVFIVMNIDKILHRIRSLFMEKYIYKKNDLIRGINYMKNYPVEQINSALDFLINEKNEYIVDSLGRLGYLTNVGEYYMFQPVEIENKNIPYDERSVPIPYKRKNMSIKLLDNIKYSQLELPKEEKSDLLNLDELNINTKTRTKKEDTVRNIYVEIQKDYQNLLEPKIVKSSEKDIWTKYAALTIKNLVDFHPNIFDRNILIQLSMNHVLDCLNYTEKLFILENVYKKRLKNDLDQIIMNYFNKFIFEENGNIGIFIADFKSKKSKIRPLLYNSGNWNVMPKKIFKSLGRKLSLKMQITDYSSLNKMIGFMDEFKKFKIVFKTKLLQRTSSGRQSKGQRCGTGGKKNIVEVINKLIDPKGRITKYKIPQGSKITEIMGESIEKIAEKNEKQNIKINSQQLCSEMELILRYYDEPIHSDGESKGETKDNKRWFFNTVDAIINEIRELTL